MSYTLETSFHTMLPREAIHPTHKAVAELGVGDFVKVSAKCANGRTEKFWVRILEIEEKAYRCVITQDMVLTRYHLLKGDDDIWIQKENIGGIIKGGL